MPNINLCRISGCRAACCHDMELPWDTLDSPVSQVFPTAQQLVYQFTSEHD